MDKVGVVVCPTNNQGNVSWSDLSTALARITGKYDYLEYIDLGIEKCDKIPQKKIEELQNEVKKVILLASDPYSETVARIVEVFRVAEFETHLIKVLDARLFSDNNNVLVDLLERYLVYWGTYLSNLSRRQLTMTISRFKSKLKRRDILRLVKRGFLERRFLPSFEPEVCVLDRGCTKCIDYCPMDALKPLSIKERKIEVYETKCVSCGICASVCPTSAVEVHSSSQEILNKSYENLRGLLGDTHPILVVSCGVYSSKFLLEKGESILRSNDVFNLELDCVGRMDPITILNYIRSGVKGIVLIDCAGECPYGIKRPLIRENFDYTRKILESFGIDPNIIQLVPVGDESGLLNAVETIRKTPFEPPSDDIIYFDKGENKFKRVIMDLSKSLNVVPKGTFSAEIYGPATISIEEIKCTMCKVCVFHCPTYSFAMEKTDGKLKLTFRLANCIACGHCVEVCPENALSIDYNFDISKVADGTIDLFKEDEMAYCKNCGAPIGPMSQLKKVERLLRLKWKNDDKAIEHIYYCEKCKKLKALGLI